MKKFEYLTIRGLPGAETNRKLNKLGEDGWLIRAADILGKELLVYLKREKPS